MNESDLICLITPPSTFLLDERVFINLGILKVAAALRVAGLRVEHLDLSGIKNFEEVAENHARGTSATCFGITATTPQLPAAVRIGRAIRTTCPDARLLLGGPHATLVNAAWKSERRRGVSHRAATARIVLESVFDTIVAGDGEEAIFEALNANASRWIDADDRRSPFFLQEKRLATLPYPARDLVDVESYRYAIEGEPATSLIAQLGCPFPCGFCGGRLSPSYRTARTRPVESIVNEMAHLYEVYGFKGFMLYDDELNVSKEIIQLMRAIKAAQDRIGVSWRLRGFIKSQLFTKEQASAMYDAGFRWILVGFESGSSRILENIQKKATKSENSRCMAIARDHGLKVKALMSLGHPGESRETALDTHAWLLQERPDDFDVTIITTYPGTPYYDDAAPHRKIAGAWTYAAKNGDQLHAYDANFAEVAEYYKGDPNGGYRSFVFTDMLSAEALVELRDFVERDVRAKLGIPFNPGVAAINFEHSMGQSGRLPGYILRQTDSKIGSLAT